MLEIKRNSTISLRHLREFLEERDEFYAEDDDEEDSGLDSLNSNSSGGSYDHQDRDLFEDVPDKLNFIGLITHYQEIQKVQWQREIIITISQGGDEVLEVSYLGFGSHLLWGKITLEFFHVTQIKANQDDPSQTNFNGINYKGKVIFLKRVTVTDYDFTNGNELLFQGSDNLYDIKIICIF